MLLRNGRLVYPQGIVEGDLRIEGEKIAEVGRGLRGGGEERIDLQGAVVIPGLVDVHVHLRDFRQREKEDFVTGTRAAIAGGVTTLLDMPNTDPPVTDPRTYQERMERASQRSLVDFDLYYGYTSQNREDLHQVRPIACKAYLNGALGQLGVPDLKPVLEGETRLAVHAEEGEGGRLQEVAALAEEREKTVHLCHLSAVDSLRHLNPFTTSEVTPHHLLLDETARETFGGISKTDPPVRSRKDREALWRALRNGRIPIIASDHAPHALVEKERGWEEAPPGIPGLDTMLRLLLTQVHRGLLSLPRLVEATSEAPARLFGIEGKGSLRTGMDADLLVLDLGKERVVKPEEFRSKARYSPFEGWTTRGDLRLAFLRGELAVQEGEILLREGAGRRVRTRDGTSLPPPR
jgi:dihydroorotase